jgi:hypothetical protein
LAGPCADAEPTENPATINPIASRDTILVIDISPSASPRISYPNDVICH